jgi:Resolvase, N terminal domain
MKDVLGLIYIRQSRHKKYERTVSPEVQEQECRELPEIQACSDVIVYKDLDLSGGSIKRRKAWLTLRARLESIRKDERVVLALYDQSRSFRNTAEALELYALLEQMPWIDVVFVHGTFDRSPIGEFSYTTLAAAHALERTASRLVRFRPGTSGGARASIARLRLMRQLRRSSVERLLSTRPAITAPASWLPASMPREW